MTNKLILLGGGGHCASVIDVIEQEGTYQIKGILDVAEKVGQEVQGYSIIGTESDIPDLVNDETLFLVTVGQIGNAEVRIRLYHIIKDAGAKMPVIVSPSAYVSPHAQLGEGTVVMHQACVNAGARIGINNIINSQALLEHHVTTGAHCHISTASVLNGDCHLGDEVLIGSRASLRQGVSIGNQVLIGMGSVVLRDIREAGLYIGVPARRYS